MKRIYLFLALFGFAIISCESDVEWFGGAEEDESNTKPVSEILPPSSIKDNEVEEVPDKENDIVSEINPSVKNTPELLLESSVTVIAKNSRNQTISQGSGAFIAQNKIVTNFHVIEVGQMFEITLNSNNELKHEARVLKVNRVHDIAILEIDTFFPDKVLKINKNYPAIGDDIIVAGTPLGFEGTISKGNISAVRKFPPDDYDLFQISAPISPGSSGGPVVNLNGELIGISVAGVKADGAQNLNFAVPAKYIYFLLQD